MLLSPMTDSKTIAIYDEQVEKYANLVSKDKPGTILQEFMESVPVGGRVLDLGCGPGNSAILMQRHGLKVTAVDASAEMVKYAKEIFALDAKVATFNDLHQIEIYDGIWANFSLLHAPEKDFSKHLSAIHRALISKGFFHIGMKLGQGMKRDAIGRKYTYFPEEELIRYLEKTGFEICSKTYGEEPGLSGEIAPWITILSQKA